MPAGRAQRVLDALVLTVPARGAPADVKIHHARQVWYSHAVLSGLLSEMPAHDAWKVVDKLVAQWPAATKEGYLANLHEFFLWAKETGVVFPLGGTVPFGV